VDDTQVAKRRGQREQHETSDQRYLTREIGAHQASLFLRNGNTHAGNLTPVSLLSGEHGPAYLLILADRLTVTDIPPERPEDAQADVA
jgi:hypothetical protein